MTSLKVLLFGTVLFFLGTAHGAFEVTNLPAPKAVASKEVGDISGVYAIRGKEPKGSYHGVCVFEKQGEAYVVRYMVGLTLTVGVGIHKGDTVSVGWRALDKSEEPVPFGVTVYRVDGNRLTGRWIGLPTKTGAVMDEELRRIDDVPKEDK